MKKIIKLDESDLLKLVKKVLSEQTVVKPNPVASVMPGQPKPQETIGKKVPTDFTKTVAFFLPNGVYFALTPLKQDISRKIMNYTGIGEQVPTNNKIQLRDKGSAVKVCDKKVVFFSTTPNKSEFNDWCSYENVNRQYTDKVGIFEIPKDPKFYSMGTYQAYTPQIPKQ